MPRIRTRAGLCAALMGMLLTLGQATPAGAQTNLLTNGGFEVDGDGTVLTNGATVSDWRSVTTAVGGVGSATVRAAAASTGAVGLELVHTSDVTWFDRWDSIAPAVTKPGVYMLLVDAKDGGIHGGQDNFTFRAVMHPAPYPEYPVACDPGPAFETFGLTAPLTADRTGIDVRLTPSATPNQSFFADNIRLLDVTLGNRVVNGGFEYSASRPVNWRAFSLAAGEFAATISSDANSGAQALRIERTGATNDGAVDLWDNRIAVLPGERLEVALQTKKLSGDAATRLQLTLLQYDASSTLLSQADVFFQPGSAAYEKFSTQLLVGANTTAVVLALRVADGSGARHVGAYLVDDVDLHRTANLLTNGDFEGQSEGDTAVLDWRQPWPGNVNLTTLAAAANGGRQGVQISTDTAVPGNDFVDRWTSLVEPATKPGIYKVLIDAKDGGSHGGQDSFQFFACMHASPYPLYGQTYQPGSDFETFGLTAPLAADRTGIDVRIVPNAVAPQSFLADNIQVIDVTRANRVVNGGFENSTSRLLSWRTFSLAAGEFLPSISSDANSGAQALRIERVAMTNDGAVDLDSDRIAVLPGETLTVGMAIKKLSGDAQTRLFVSIAQYDAAGTYLGGALQTNAAFEATAAYGLFSTPITIDGAAAYINIGLRVGNDAGGDRHLGAYLVDDVTVVRNQAPSFTAATLVPNIDNTSLQVAASGWSDPDGDAELYTYQWKLNGVAIGGATGPALDRSVYGTTGSVTCEVTAYDGTIAGNTIETPAVLVPVALSTFSIE